MSVIASKMSLFDSIGHSYSATRFAEPRIVKVLSDLLGPASGRTVADIGAGTGNYSVALAEQGWSVIAIEPSAVMRGQCRNHKAITWIDAKAESLALPDQSVDAAICVLALHHLQNMPAAFAEMARVVRNGPIVLFTFDPRAAQPFWLADYFPGIFQSGYEIFPPINDVKSMLARATGRTVTDLAFPLPPDLSDVFLAACWRSPHLYLDSQIRAGMSGFMLANENEVADGLERLSKDLEDGSWQQKYGGVLNLETFDAGYRFIVATKAQVKARVVGYSANTFISKR
jgi:ubiquinone/menaquinone biosynthesis C-methylase UbiE